MSKQRVAGFNERRCISRDVLGLYGWVAVTAKYSWTSQKSTWQVQFSNAVKHCLSKHAALSAIVRTASNPPTVVQLPQVDIRKHIHVVTDQQKTTEDALGALLANVHRHPLVHDGSTPQWHLFLTPVVESGSKMTLLAAFAGSHVLMDGMSCYKFHATLLEGLNSHNTSLEPDPIWLSSSSQDTLPPALDQAANLSISWSFLLKPLLGEFLPERAVRALGISKEPGVWHGADKRPTIPEGRGLIKTAVSISSLSALELDQVLQLCRRHQCKLTSLIDFVFAHCLAQALADRQRAATKFTVEVAYDLRRCLPGTEDSMANYASAVEVMLDSGATSNHDEMWETIKLHTELLQRSASMLNDQAVALLKYLSDFDEWVSRKSTQPAEASFSMSNIGNFVPSARSRGEWTVQEMVFSQSGDATGAPFNLNVASCQGGQLWIVLTWWPGMLGVKDEPVFAMDIGEQLVRRLRELIA